MFDFDSFFHYNFSFDKLFRYKILTDKLFLKIDFTFDWDKCLKRLFFIKIGMFLSLEEWSFWCFVIDNDFILLLKCPYQGFSTTLIEF